MHFWSALCEKGILKFEMTVWFHNKWTLFKRVDVRRALLCQVLLDGYDLLFPRTNYLLRSPCHLHVPGYPAFWLCSVFSVSIRVLILIYARVLYLSIYSSLLRICPLFSIIEHMTSRRSLKLSGTSSLIRKTCAHNVILCTTSSVFICTYLSSVPEWMYVRSCWPTSRTSNSLKNDPRSIRTLLLYDSLNYCAVSYFMNRERRERHREKVIRNTSHFYT